MNTGILLALLALTSATPPQTPAPQPEASAQASTPYSPMLRFDAHRDAAADIHTAILEAQRSHRRILLDIGGEWCGYCLEMDSLFHDNKDLLSLRDSLYVVVPIYYDDTHKNEKALAGLPPIEGIPHLYILDDHGALIHSQHAVELRESGAYSPAKIKAFLERWSDAPAPPSVPSSVSHPQSSALRPPNP